MDCHCTSGRKCEPCMVESGTLPPAPEQEEHTTDGTPCPCGWRQGGCLDAD